MAVRPFIPYADRRLHMPAAAVEAVTDEIRAIWDAGGIDTLDASNQALGAAIDLGAGAFSSIGVRDGGRAAAQNVAIAYGVVIENATGSGGNDTITDFTKNGVPPRDRIGFDISETGVDSMAKLSIATVGGVVVISWGAGTGATGTGSITLTGVTNPALFTATDFLFVA